MSALAGLIAAFTIVILGKAMRQDGTTPFYSTVLIVIALLCVLFAVMAGGASTIVAESAIAAVFVRIAVGGARWRRPQAAGLLIAAGLVGHGACDLTHDDVVANAAVPQWWPVFCGVVDLALGAWLTGRTATISLKGRRPAA